MIRSGQRWSVNLMPLLKSYDSVMTTKKLVKDVRQN